LFNNESKLINKIKNGNQKAFRQLYNQYSGYALRTAYAITKSNNDAADIVQETFIKVYRNINQFDQSKPFKPWFYRILLNESRRYMKKQNKQGTVVESEQLMDYLHAEASRENEQNSDVLSILDLVSDRHRAVLVLKYLHDFTEKEIATILELNINTVKSRLYKARQRLRSILGGESVE